MTDIFDRATDQEERFRDAALQAQARNAPLQGNWEALSAKWCDGPACGARIPDERRRAFPGVQRCLVCQERKEKQGKR